MILHADRGQETLRLGCQMSTWTLTWVVSRQMVTGEGMEQVDKSLTFCSIDKAGDGKEFKGQLESLQ